MRLLILFVGVAIGTYLTMKLIWTKEPARPDTPTLTVYKDKGWPDSGTYTEYDGTRWSWTTS